MTSNWPPQAAGPGHNQRLAVNAGRLWAGGVATAVVAALIAVVGIVIARGIFQVALVAPKQAGTWGDVSTGVYAAVAFGAGLLATALIHVLLLSTPSPFSYFGWIVGLATLAAVVAPFTTGAGLESKVSTAVINAILGLAVWSLTSSGAHRSQYRGYPARVDGPPNTPR